MRGAVAFGRARLRRPPASAVSHFHVRGRRRRRERARAGMRAVVPFRNRREIGVIVGAAEPAPTASRRSASRSAGRRAGARRRECSRSANGSPSTTSCRSASRFAARCPPRCRRTTPGAVAADAARRDDRDASLPSLIQRDGVFARAPQQRALFELIESLGGRARGRASHRRS